MARAHYKREELASLHDAEEDIQKKLEILEQLTNRLQGFQNPDLSHDEKYWIYDQILINSWYFENYQTHWNEKIQILNHVLLRDYRFLYLIQNCGYYNDLNGHRYHKHLFNKEFTTTEKTDNVLFLHEIADEWQTIISRRNHADQLLLKLSVEAEKIIKEELQAAKNAGIGFNLREIYRKQLILMYKYIYLRGKEVFRDAQEHYFNINGKNIIFDHNSFVHLGRHIAPSLRPGYIGKSNFSQDFLLGNVSTLIGEVFAKISACENVNEIEIKPNTDTQLFFELNGVVYSAWFESSNKTGAEVFRLTSIYPSEDQIEKGKWTKKSKIFITDKLYFFQ